MHGHRIGYVRVSSFNQNPGNCHVNRRQTEFAARPGALVSACPRLPAASTGLCPGRHRMRIWTAAAGDVIFDLPLVLHNSGFDAVGIIR